MSKASEHDTNYFQAVPVRKMQGKKMPTKIYADKGYCSQDNREFLSLNRMADGIMRKDYPNAKLTELEHERNGGFAKIRYKIEQYFGIDREQPITGTGGRTRFTTLIKEHWNRLCRVMAFNSKRVLLAERRKTQEVMA